jgi:tetratricopeptide (TPR) repeat protein
VQKARQASDPGFYTNANACAEVALELKPAYPIALDLRAMVLMNNHSFKEARDLMLEVLKASPDDLMALGTISDALLELGDFEGAANYAQQMIDVRPFLASYVRAGYIRWLSGDTEGAKELVALALEGGAGRRDPEPYAWATVEYAKLFFQQGDYAGAEQRVDRALDAVPEYAPALAFKARVLAARGKAEDALPLAKKALEASPLAETAWLVADLERALGHSGDEAVAKLIKLGRQGDKKTLAAFFATENRDLPEALQLIRSELEHRGDVYTHDVHAWALYRAGKLQEAKAESDRATALGTKDALLMYHAGAIRIALGDKTGLDLVKAALALNPKFQLRGSSEAAALVVKTSGG